MIRSILLLLLAIPGMAGPLYPPEWTPTKVSKWGGLNTLGASDEIGDYEAQEAINVFTDNGYLEKRTGNTTLVNTGISQQIDYVKEFISNSGSRYLIFHTSDTVYSTDLSAAPVIVATTTHGQNVNSVTAFGKEVIVDGQDASATWDGSSLSVSTIIPVGNLVEFYYERVVVGNIPSISGSKISLSANGDVTNFAVPSNVATVADAPNAFYFNQNDGESVTCMKRTPYGLLVGKPHSMHLLKGYDNLTFYKQVLDTTVGCFDNNSVQIVDGVVVWAGQYGIYGWNGSGAVQLLTLNIEPTYRTIRQLTSNLAQGAVATQADWKAGTYTVNGALSSWDTDVSPGYIVAASTTFAEGQAPPLFSSGRTFYGGTATGNLVVYPSSITFSTTPYTNLDNFQDGDYVSSPTWTSTDDGNTIINTGSDGAKYLNLETQNMTVKTSGVNSKATGTWYFRYAESGGAARYGGVFPFYNNVDGWGVYLSDPASALIAIVKDSLLVDTTYSGSCAHTNPVNIALSRDANGVMKLYCNGTQVATRTDTSLNNYGVVKIKSGATAGTSVSVTSITYSEIPIFDATIASGIPAQSSGSYVSRIFDTKMSSSIPGSFSADISTSAFLKYNLTASSSSVVFYVRNSSSPNNDNWTTYAATTDTLRINLNKRYWQYKADFFVPDPSSGTNNFGIVFSTNMPFLYDVSMAAISSGVYYSKLIPLDANASAFKTFNVSDSQNPSGVLAYSVRAGTYAFGLADSIPAWTSQTSNRNVAISTSAYFQFKIDSSGLGASTQTANVSRVSVIWQDGVSALSASAYKNHRYLFCGIFSTTAVINDQCLLLQKNKTWVKWSGPKIGSMGLYNNNIVMGDGSTSGKVWNIFQDGVYRDDTQAISSTWTSKDFSDEIAYNNKALHEMWINAATFQASSVTVAYAIDKATWTIGKTVSLDTGGAVLIKRIPLDAGYAVGKFVRVSLLDPFVNSYTRVNEYLLYLENKPRSLDNQ